MLRRLMPFLIKYFMQLRIAFHEAISLIGFMILLVIVNQLFSGVMLSFSLVLEPMYVPLVREEEDSENLYTDDFFWLHERGVDLLVIFMFLHLFRKLYMNVMDTEQEYAWKAGVLLYLLAQVVIFLGLVLCCTHLSDITLTIASNAFQTFCFFLGKFYWLIFPDQTLNADTIIRLAYLHYVLGFCLAFFSVNHGVDMHYDWKIEPSFDGIKQELNWFDEALVNEIGKSIDFLMLAGILCFYLYAEPEPLSYEIFMWGDIGMSVDIRFYGVAPHWYFRPYMAWLIACPYHYTGIIGLVLFFVSFYFQPNIIGRSEFGGYSSNLKSIMYTIFYSFEGRLIKYTPLYKIYPESDKFYQVTYALFLMSMWYAFSYLPYGRFFNRLGGNVASLVIYVYIFIYLSGPYLRIPQTYNLYKINAY